jgi:Glycosyl hydrolase family 1
VDGGAVRGKLERVAVAARNEHGTAALFFLWGSGGEKIIRLEARRFCILEAACGGRDETIWSRSTMACDMAQWSALHAPVLITDELCISVITLAPFATLYHWDLPQALQDKNKGWQSRDTAKAFADYAGYVAEKLSDRVHHFLGGRELSTSPPA